MYVYVCTKWCDWIRKFYHMNPYHIVLSKYFIYVLYVYIYVCMYILYRGMNEYSLCQEYRS